VAWFQEPDRGFTRAKICTWDRAGLFSIMTGSFAAAGITILSGQIFTRHDNIVLDTFSVMDASQGGPVGRTERERFEEILVRALTIGSAISRPSSPPEVQPRALCRPGRRNHPDAHCL